MRARFLNRDFLDRRVGHRGRDRAQVNRQGDLTRLGRQAERQMDDALDPADEIIFARASLRHARSVSTSDDQLRIGALAGCGSNQR